MSTDLVWVDDTAFIRREPDPYRRVALLADVLRLNSLSAIMRAGSGHIGTCFSSAEIVAHFALKGVPLVSSKGHDAPLLYAACAAIGLLPPKALRTLRTPGGLPGHPEAGVAGMEASTGSLGVGLSKAMGLLRARNDPWRVVLMGDGEMQEGMVWEALQHYDGRLTVVVDANEFGSDEATAADRLYEKLTAFGWPAYWCDGHDPLDLAKACQPGTAVVAHTIKGKGVSFMEAGVGMYRYHSGAPTGVEYVEALVQIVERLRGSGVQYVSDEMTDRMSPPPDPFMSAYADALVGVGADERVVVLDADLVKDCGLLPFRARYPERFIECGISEQHMVSLAGGLALGGKVPIVHTFAAFMVRAAEQVYMNSIDRTRVIYVGSLTRPHRAGPSHEAVMDLPVMSAVPGMTVVSVHSPDLVADALRDAVRREGPTYLRLP